MDENDRKMLFGNAMPAHLVTVRDRMLPHSVSHFPHCENPLNTVNFFPDAAGGAAALAHADELLGKYRKSLISGIGDSNVRGYHGENFQL